MINKIKKKLIPTKINRPCIGIDLDTTYSCVGIFQNNRVQTIVNHQGNRTTPFYVTFIDNQRLIGDAVKNQSSINHENTVFHAKS